MIDPPWRWKSYSDKGYTKSPQAHYECASLDDIKDMNVRSILAKDAFVHLWATAPMDEQAHEVMRAWGLTFVTQGVWVKMTKDNSRPHFGTGYILRNCHEPFYIAKVGNPKVLSRSIRSVIMAPRREHSRKPDQAYTNAEAMVGDAPKADIFARESRSGWTPFGLEREKFDPSDALAGILGFGA